MPDATNITLPALQLQLEREHEGRRHYITRDRVPFQGLTLAALAAQPSVQREAHGEPDGELEAARGGHLEGEKYQALLTVTASSTGVDQHGTEMTERALVGMAQQMNNGVVYLPSHGEYEWDDVIGKTLEASIEQGRVELDGATGTQGDGKVLRVVVGLYADDDRASKLARIVRQAQHSVGTSIGGWFTDMEFVVNSQDEVERVLIHGVELDHLATTRRPSNRESWIDGLMERATAAIASTIPAPAPALQERGPAGQLQERHLWKVVEDEDSVHLVFGKSGDHWEGVHAMPEEVQDEPDTAERSEDSEGERSAEAHSGDGTVSPPAAQELDTAASVGEDQRDRTDAVQRAEPTNPSTGDASMDERTPTPTTDDRLDALARSQAQLSEQLGGLVALLTAQAQERASAPTEPVPAPADPHAELQRQNEELRAKLQRTMSAAGRAGMAATLQRRVDTAGGFKGMVTRCAGSLPATSALRMVCEAQAERRDASISKTPTRGELEADLRSLLTAAFADGIITDPDEGSWS